jgi:hypothetical protein
VRHWSDCEVKRLRRTIRVEHQVEMPGSLRRVRPKAFAAFDPVMGGRVMGRIKVQQTGLLWSISQRLRTQASIGRHPGSKQKSATAHTAAADTSLPSPRLRWPGLTGLLSGASVRPRFSRILGRYAGRAQHHQGLAGAQRIALEFLCLAPPAADSSKRFTTENTMAY